MTCTGCREALSALLDGEDLPGERAAVDAHLAGCPDCRRFAERVAHVTRLARTEPVRPLPALPVAALVASVRRQPWPVRLHTPLRVLLGVLGVGQLGLATGELLGAPDHGPGSAVPGVTLTHFSHESSAWNLALAVGFLCVAVRPSRIRGLLPLVGAFVGGLVALSVPDLAMGSVAGSRLLAHGVAVLGLVALLVLARATRRPTGGRPDGMSRGESEPSVTGPSGAAFGGGPAGPGSGWTGHGDDLQPSAHRHAA
jgi:predicted anti-sigma-YlaC factor YlaD